MYFYYTYTWKSWHLVGFEPTLFGRAKVQPHCAYQRIAKTHMVYISPEKGVFSYTYAWKSWHLVGFEPTMRLQPYAKQIPYAIQKGIWSIFGRKKCIFWYLHLKMLALGGIWTHTVRAGEGATTLRVSAHSKNAYGLYLAGKRCICLYLHLKKLAPGGIGTHTVRTGEGATT